MLQLTLFGRWNQGCASGPGQCLELDGGHAAEGVLASAAVMGLLDPEDDRRAQWLAGGAPVGLPAKRASQVREWLRRAPPICVPRAKTPLTVATIACTEAGSRSDGDAGLCGCATSTLPSSGPFARWMRCE